MANKVYCGDNLPILGALAGGSIDLVYIDPPFNTGKAQQHTQIKTVRSEAGDRTGFQGQRYATVKIGTRSYADLFDDYLAFLEPRLTEIYRLLAPMGHSTSTSITAKFTTANCCWIPFSAGRVS